MERKVNSEGERMETKMSEKVRRNHSINYRPLKKYYNTHKPVQIYIHSFNELLSSRLRMLPHRAKDPETKTTPDIYRSTSFLYCWSRFSTCKCLKHYSLLLLLLVGPPERRQILTAREDMHFKCPWDGPDLNAFSLRTRFHVTRRCYASFWRRETTINPTQLW